MSDAHGDEAKRYESQLWWVLDYRDPAKRLRKDCRLADSDVSTGDPFGSPGVGCETSEADDARSKHEDVHMNYYPRHLGDYASQAGYLSALEHGVYTLLLDWYHKNERAIPKELVYQISKANSSVEKKAVIKVLDAFFKWNPEQGWQHEGADATIAKMRATREKKRSASNQRWHPKGI
jgi:hypothetical protein